MCKGVITKCAAKRKSVRGATYFVREVVYQYRVDGRELTSNVVVESNFYLTGFGNAEAILGRHREGAEIAVHVNPRDPKDAVLEPGYLDAWIVVFGASMAFFIFAVAVQFLK